MANKKDNTAEKESPDDIAKKNEEKQLNENIEDVIEWILFKKI